MGLLTEILLFFSAYSPIVSLIGAILGGEETIILLSVIAAQGYMNIFVVAFFCFIGIMISDLIWFYIGKSRLFHWALKFHLLKLAYRKWAKLLIASTENDDFQALMTTKFFYGFRIITIMYLSKKRLNLEKFIDYSLIVNAIWIAVIVTIGWLAGKGVQFAIVFTNNLFVAFICLGIFIILFTFLMRLSGKIVKKWLIKKQKK